MSNNVSKAAMARMVAAHNAYLNGNGAFVHFSTGINNQYPAIADCPIHAIVVMYRICGNPDYKLFTASSGINEAAALTAFAKFTRNHRYWKWIVWRSEVVYGLYHVRERLHHLTGIGTNKDGLPKTANTLAINQHLQDVYGNNYAPHNRMQNCFNMNGITPANILDATAAKAAFDAGEVDKLTLSAIAKCKGFEEVLSRAVLHTLVTASSSVTPKPQPNGSTESIDYSTADSMKLLGPKSHDTWQRYAKKAGINGRRGRGNRNTIPELVKVAQAIVAGNGDELMKETSRRFIADNAASKPHQIRKP